MRFVEKTSLFIGCLSTPWAARHRWRSWVRMVFSTSWFIGRCSTREIFCGSWGTFALSVWSLIPVKTKDDKPETYLLNKTAQFMTWLIRGCSCHSLCLSVCCIIYQEADVDVFPKEPAELLPMLGLLPKLGIKLEDHPLNDDILSMMEKLLKTLEYPKRIAAYSSNFRQLSCAR